MTQTSVLSEISCNVVFTLKKKILFFWNDKFSVKISDKHQKLSLII